ncbi:SLATT domain-containing protein [Prescottella defluvii]|nr:SLATT domain-containing protein [Prescottella defluvii]
MRSTDSDGNLDVIRETFGRVVYTHKTHEKDREIAAQRSVRMKWINIALTALTFGGIVTVAAVDETAFVIASVVLATLTLAFTIFQLSFDPAQDAARHRAAAKSLLSVRDRYVNLIADAMAGMPAADLRTRRDELQQELDDLYQHAPDTTWRAYDRARTALKDNEEFTFSADEIDLFLPEGLRLNRTRGVAKSEPPSAVSDGKNGQSAR